MDNKHSLLKGILCTTFPQQQGKVLQLHMFFASMLLSPSARQAMQSMRHASTPELFLSSNTSEPSQPGHLPGLAQASEEWFRVHLQIVSGVQGSLSDYLWELLAIHKCGPRFPKPQSVSMIH